MKESKSYFLFIVKIIFEIIKCIYFIDKEIIITETKQNLHLDNELYRLMENKQVTYQTEENGKRRRKKQTHN